MKIVPASEGALSTASRHFGGTHVRLSRDVLKTRARESVLWHACLAIGQKFVIDNTNCVVATRAPIIAMAKAAGFRVVAYHLLSDVPTALHRNASRFGTARVPDVAIHATAAKLEAPSYSEGFDAVNRVTIVGDAYEIEEVLNEG